jgi:hypothetical protein
LTRAAQGSDLSTQNGGKATECWILNSQRWNAAGDHRHAGKPGSFPLLDLRATDRQYLPLGGTVICEAARLG